MESLFSHLKELFSEEAFEDNQSAFSITVYTNLNYAADNVYAHVKRHRGKMNGRILQNKYLLKMSLRYKILGQM